jgi:hypothetical protein
MTFRRAVTEAGSNLDSVYLLLFVVSCLDWSTALKIGAIFSSETSGSLQIARNYNSDDRILHGHLCEGFRSKIPYSVTLPTEKTFRFEIQKCLC